jgi:hypothetical protein
MGSKEVELCKQEDVQVLGEPVERFRKRST